MPVVTRKRSSEFCIIPNAVAEDNRLSYDARGLLCYLLAKPHNWKVQIANIQSAGGIGKDKAYKLINELKDVGYIVHSIVRNKKTGRVQEHNYTVYDCAVPATLPLTKNPEVVKIRSSKLAENDLLSENPEVALPLPENPASGKSGSNTNNEYIIKTHPPSPPNGESEQEIRFEKIWSTMSSDDRPINRGAAYAEFKKLNDAEQTDATQYFEYFLKEQFWFSRKPKLIPYLGEKRWLKFVYAPKTDKEGYFVIKSYRPEWQVWLDEIKKTRGEVEEAKARSRGVIYCKRRWPTDRDRNEVLMRNV